MEMTRIVTLRDILLTQDYSEKYVDTMLEKLIADELDMSNDPITGYIINAFQRAIDNRSFGDEDDFLSDVDCDLSYAIDQLTRARAALRQSS